MRAKEFIRELYDVPIRDLQIGPDISPELRQYKERGTMDTFMPDERAKGAQDILGPGQIKQMRAVQNIAPSSSFPQTGAMGSVYSPPKYDTTPVIPTNPKYVTTFEPPEKAMSNPLKVNSMVRSLEAGKQLPPITVKSTDTGYQVVDGHHRFAAHQQAGSKTIPVKVIEPENVKTINEPTQNWGYDQATKDFLKPGYGSVKAKTISGKINLKK